VGDGGLFHLHGCREIVDRAGAVAQAGQDPQSARRRQQRRGDRGCGVGALSRRARHIVIANLAIAITFITGLVLWDLLGHLPLPLGVAGHEGSTVIVGLNGMRLLARRAWGAPTYERVGPVEQNHRCGARAVVSFLLRWPQPVPRRRVRKKAAGRPSPRPAGR
jgi:hypothetical protein